MTEKIRSFEDLIVWQKGHKLVLSIYKITKDFPSCENFCLTSQMRRAVVSITSNIAEGFSRKGLKEKTQFYYMAQASLTELKNQLIITRDINYIENNQYQEIDGQIITVGKLLSGLIRSIK